MTLIKDLGDPRFWAFFTDFKEESFRLETLQQYAVSYEEGPYRDFLDGVPRYTHPDQAEWAANVAARLAHGARMRRVHVVEEPLTEYLRFELTWPYRDSVEAGEDVRLIPVPRGAWPAALPREDYWLFDRKVAALMRYGLGGEFLEAEITEDPPTIARCVAARNEALRRSVTYAEYMSETGLG